MGFSRSYNRWFNYAVGFVVALMIADWRVGINPLAHLLRHLLIGGSLSLAIQEFRLCRYRLVPSSVPRCEFKNVVCFDSEWPDPGELPRMADLKDDGRAVLLGDRLIPYDQIVDVRFAVMRKLGDAVVLRTPQTTCDGRPLMLNHRPTKEIFYELARHTTTRRAVAEETRRPLNRVFDVGAR